MIRQIKQCFLLYLREPRFMILSGLSLVSLCAMQALIYWGIEKNLWNNSLAQKYILGDELLSGIFIVGLWLMFSLGLLIKKQFANDRASLVPGYRVPHIMTAMGILMFMISITIFLSKGAMALSQLFFIQVLGVTVSLWAIYLLILIMAHVMLYLGYLSVGYIVVVGYIFLAVLAQNITTVLQIFTTSVFSFYTTTTILLTMIILFVYRLWVLKSEHAEYSFLITWPPKKTLRNQLALGNSLEQVRIRCLKTFGWTPREPLIPSYYNLQGTWSRASHWGYSEKSNIFSLLIFSALCLPLYYLFLKSSLAEFLIITKIEYNFLLFAGAPVLLTVITNYKNMIFWNTDLLKPVSRENFFKEQGTKFFRDLIVYWVIIAGYFAIMPDWIYGTQQLGQSHFWVFLFLTFTFSLLCLAWLGVLSALSNERAVIANGLLLSLLIMLEFLGSGRTPTVWIIINALLCLILSVLFLKLSYRKWVNKEF